MVRWLRVQPFPRIRIHCRTFRCSVTSHSGSCTPTSGISRMKCVLSIAESKPDMKHGERSSSMVRAPDSWWEGRGFESRQERRENVLLLDQLSVLTLISVSIPSPCYHSSTQKIQAMLPKMQLAGYSKTRLHPMYVTARSAFFIHLLSTEVVC